MCVAKKMDGLSIRSVKSHLRSSIIVKARGTNVVLRGRVLVSSDTSMLFIGSVLVKSADFLQSQNIR